MFTPTFTFETEDGIGFKANAIKGGQVGTEFCWFAKDDASFDKAIALYEELSGETSQKVKVL